MHLNDGTLLASTTHEQALILAVLYEDGPMTKKILEQRLVDRGITAIPAIKEAMRALPDFIVGKRYPLLVLTESSKRLALVVAHSVLSEPTLEKIIPPSYALAALVRACRDFGIDPNLTHRVGGGWTYAQLKRTYESPFMSDDEASDRPKTVDAWLDLFICRGIAFNYGGHIFFVGIDTLDALAEAVALANPDPKNPEEPDES